MAQESIQVRELVAKLTCQRLHLVRCRYPAIYNWEYKKIYGPCNIPKNFIQWDIGAIGSGMSTSRELERYAEEVKVWIYLSVACLATLEWRLEGTKEIKFA